MQLVLIFFLLSYSFNSWSKTRIHCFCAGSTKPQVDNGNSMFVIQSAVPVVWSNYTIVKQGCNTAMLLSYLFQ